MCDSALGLYKTNPFFYFNILSMIFGLRFSRILFYLHKIRRPKYSDSEFFSEELYYYFGVSIRIYLISFTVWYTYYTLYLCYIDWDREKLLEAWMSNAEDCCQRSGVQMPTPPPKGYNAWDTLPSPRTPRTTRSSITSPDEISLSPADDDRSLVRMQKPFLSVEAVQVYIIYSVSVSHVVGGRCQCHFYGLGLFVC